MEQNQQQAITEHPDYPGVPAYPGPALPPSTSLRAPMPSPQHHPVAHPTPHPYAPSATMGTAPVRWVTDQRPTSGAVIAIAWVLTVVTLGYLLPWAVAASRGRANQGAIAVLNIFLGWSFVGWVVSLVMACQAHRVSVAPTANVLVVNQPPAQPVQPVLPPAGWYPAPDGYGQQYWDGRTWTAHRA